MIKVQLEGSRRLYHSMERGAWRYMNHVVANSSYIKTLIQKAGLAKEVSVLNPGVNLDIYKPSWNYEKYFLVPGWMNVYKRQYLAIDAFKLFMKNSKHKEFKLIIVGRVLEKDTWYYNKLKELSQNDSNIIIIPNDKKLLHLYQNAYAVLVPSMSEAWGLVAVEAMACGKPVIATNNGGVGESVMDGKTGFIVSATPSEFAEKMELLANDNELHRQMGANAHERALHYDWEKFVREFDAHIEITEELVTKSQIKSVLSGTSQRYG